MKSKMNLLLSVAKNKLITILITQFLVSTSISAVDPTPACIDKQKSVLFILDGSGSVGKSNFKASLDFIQVISDYLEIGEASQDVALEQFGSENQLVWQGDKFYQNRNDFYGMLEKVNYLKGGTATCPALDYANYNILQTKEVSKGVGFEHSIVVITDGQHNEGRPPYHCADKLRSERNSTIFVVAVGDVAGEEGAYEELISIANSPADQYTKIGAWDKLTNPNDPQRYLQAEDLAKKICGAKYCTCDNGEAAIEDDCPVSGMERCRDCDFGYRMNTDFKICYDDPYSEDLKHVEYDSEIGVSKEWTNKYDNTNSNEFKELEGDLEATYKLALGKYYDGLKLLSVEKDLNLTVVVSDSAVQPSKIIGSRNYFAPVNEVLKLTAEPEHLFCNISINMQGYESDNLADIYNEKIEENELVFSFMGYDVPEAIPTPCSMTIDDGCKKGQVCVNNANNTEFSCESCGIVKRFAVFMTLIGFLFI